MPAPLLLLVCCAVQVAAALFFLLSVLLLLASWLPIEQLLVVLGVLCSPCHNVGTH